MELDKLPKMVSYKADIHLGGPHLVVFFENGYGMSAIQNSCSYGGRDGFWEAAVLKGNQEEWRIVYDTPVTNDVAGWLSEDEVKEFALAVSRL